MTIKIGHLEFDDVVYDADSDVLYLSIGEPRPAADTEETSQGHAIRYDASGEIVGITIVNAKWLIERGGQIELPLRLDAEDLAPALSDLRHLGQSQLCADGLSRELATRRTGYGRGVRHSALRVVADINERRSGIPAALSSHGVAIELAVLPAGDYAVGLDTLVERKAVADLHAAIAKGSFWPQIGKLRRAARYPFFLVEGQDLDRGPIAPAAIRGVCLAVIEQGIRLIRTSDRRDSALWLHRLAVRRRATRQNRPAYAQRRQPKSAHEAAEAMLAAVPGISTSTARALLAYFGSVQAVLSAGPEDWLEVPSIGRHRIEALQAALHQRFSS